MTSMIKTKVQAASFHRTFDTEVAHRLTRFTETTETKYFIVQERELGYRFYLHQHPYVQQLVQRLLTKSTAGLQAADTEYVAGHASLPASVVVALAKAVSQSIPVGSRIALLAKVQATAGAAPIELAGNMELRTAAAAPASLPDGMTVTLVEGLSETPATGSVFSPAGGTEAIVFGATKVAFAAATPVTLHDGSQATVPAGTQALLADGSALTLDGGAQVTLLKGKALPVLFADFFDAAYVPNPDLLERPFPVKDLDFSSSGAYAVYNWELFFHVPLTIAIHLSKNQRFAEAQRWFHFLFDPTDDSDGPTPERFWKVRPFQYTDVRKIEEILVNLATGADESLRTETIRSIEAWKDAPFRPHVIARYRQQAYMFKTVMAYLDNLIAWGDSLFRQDTGEAVDEALMIYVLAANILGPRPQPVPRKGTVRPQTYANLREDIAMFGIVMRDVEADLPFDLMPFPADDGGDNDPLATLRSLGKAPYFCVPRNDKLLTYWDTVADRLFKIHNSLNLQGIFRQLALFEPPIDPAMLVRATAAGLDVGSIVNGLNQPLPLVRFPFLVQKALEVCQEVKSLGGNLLSAMEKEDGESLAILRAKHERVIAEMVEQVRYAQLQEAGKSKDGLLQSLALSVERYTYYEQQLGRQKDEIIKGIPGLDDLDRSSLEKLKFSAKEPTVATREIEVDIAQDLAASGGKIMSSHEATDLAKLEEARQKQDSGADLDKVGAGLATIPTFGARFQPFGAGGTVSFGGSNLAAHFTLLASFDKTEAERKTYEAGKAAKVGSYARREQEWVFQSNLAAREITQVLRQLRAAEIREAIADLDLRNHRQQMKHASEIEHFLNQNDTEKTGKVTNKALYTWMKRELKGLYGQYFQFAFDTARKAERALQHELGNAELRYLEFGYLAGKEGLLAGERLLLDVKRMELAYHELNQREYELTKHVSLLQVDPLALIELRATGRCTVQLPENLFDADGPGHYFRRIKSVALSVPCVTGPYAAVSCTLTLLKSTIRTTPVVGDAYERADAEDARFSDYFGSMQSIVTSSGQNDSGLFETNLRDERYLPFEGSGVISEWQLQLPADPSNDDPTPFDYETISDVILHLRYTAREGGGLLRKGAVDHLTGLIDDAHAIGSTRMFSVRHEFPNEWAVFTAKTPAANQRSELALTITDEHYPYWSKGRLNRVIRIDILARSSEKQVPASLGIAGTAAEQDPAKIDQLNKDATLGNLLVGDLKNVGLPAKPAGELKLYFDQNQLDELWVAVTWGA